MRSLSLTSLPKKTLSQSNRVADNSQAAIFGQQLFFDSGFSGNGEISCASCHQADKYFTDQRALAVGLGETGRNSPTIIASAWSRWLYWDGRKDSLWSQALVPFEALNEMGTTRTDVINKISQNNRYLKQYQTLFGQLPSRIKTGQLPSASPIGNALAKDNWYRLPHSLKRDINRAYSNIGKAIAAYERTLMPPLTRFDKYVDALISKQKQQVNITAQEALGIKLFIDSNKTNCLQCHNGALLTNGGFHNIGTGSFTEGRLDFGRSLGIQAVIMDEFNCLGRYSDADAEQCHQLKFLDSSFQHGDMDGAYKTPSLRGLKLTWPYFHDGRFASLEQVIEHYVDPPQTNGAHELKALKLSTKEQSALISFLEMLSE